MVVLVVHELRHFPRTPHCHLLSFAAAHILANVQHILGIHPG